MGLTWNFKDVLFSSYRAKERNKCEKSLLYENNKERVLQLQSELQDLRQQQLNGYFVRSVKMD